MKVLLNKIIKIKYNENNVLKQNIVLKMVIK